MKLKANYHTHTSLCDGTASPEEMVLEALRKGFDHLGFSGHVDIHPQMDVPAYQQEIRSLAKKYAGEIEILCGGELDSLYPDQHPAGFDYLIGSVHHLEAGAEEPLAVDWDVQMERLLKECYGGDGYRLCRDYYRQVAEAFGGGGCTWLLDTIRTCALWTRKILAISGRPLKPSICWQREDCRWRSIQNRCGLARSILPSRF